MRSDTISFIVFMTLAAVVMYGCSGNSGRYAEPQVAQTIKQGRGEQELVRYEDKDNNVVCYRVKALEGLSCLRVKNE